MSCHMIGHNCTLATSIVYEWFACAWLQKFVNWPRLLYKPFGTSVQHIKGKVALTLEYQINLSVLQNSHKMPLLQLDSVFWFKFLSKLANTKFWLVTILPLFAHAICKNSYGRPFGWMWYLNLPKVLSVLCKKKQILTNLLFGRP